MSWSNDTLCWSTLIVSAVTQGKAQKVQGKYGPKSGVSDLLLYSRAEPEAFGDWSALCVLILTWVYKEEKKWKEQRRGETGNGVCQGTTK